MTRCLPGHGPPCPSHPPSQSLVQLGTFWGSFRRSELGDFPGGPAVKTPNSLCRALGFDPWSGNWMPHAAMKIPRVATTEKVLQAAAKMEDPAGHCQDPAQPEGDKRGIRAPPKWPWFSIVQNSPTDWTFRKPYQYPTWPGACRPPCPEQRAPHPESWAPGWVWSRVSGTARRPWMMGSPWLRKPWACVEGDLAGEVGLSRWHWGTGDPGRETGWGTAMRGARGQGCSRRLGPGWRVAPPPAAPRGRGGGRLVYCSP